MSFIGQLRQRWDQAGSLVCVGLDPEPARLPASLQGRANAVLDFNRAIIDATAEVPPAVRDDARVAPRVTEGQACRLDLLACPSEDRNRLLLFLSAISGAKRPLILR